MKGFVGLKSKTYTFIIKDNHASKKAKDINNNSLNHIFVNMIVNYVNNNFVEYRQFILILPLVRRATFSQFFNAIKI